MTSRFLAALGLAGLLAAAPAGAHVVLDQAEAPADGYVRVALRVGHGCNGAATTAIRLAVPPELKAARPMPHPGWTLSVGGTTPPAGHVDHAAHGAHAGHHAPVAPGEIAWTGGRLDDAFYDEFVLQIRTPAAPGSVIVFPVIQECEGGAVARWTERPVEGTRVPNPAPTLRLVSR